MKRDSSITSYKFHVFCVRTILYHSFKSKFEFRKLSTWPICCFLNKLTFFSQNWYFFQKVESSLEEKRAEESFQTVLVITFSYFFIISFRCQSPRVNRYLISSITNLVHELPYELSNELRLRILGN